MMKFKEIPAYKDPSPLRISTITSLMCFDKKFDLVECFERIRPEGLANLKEGVSSVKIFRKRPHLNDIEALEKTKAGLKSTSVSSCFQNQMTLILNFTPSQDDPLASPLPFPLPSPVRSPSLQEEEQVVDVHKDIQHPQQQQQVSNTKRVNCFVFKDGKIKIAGLKSVADLTICDEALLKIFRASIDPDLQLVSSLPVMLNTDFTIHFRLNRTVLFLLIINEYSLCLSRYDPELYPGVKVKYSWNEIYHGDGICHCVKSCKGKGRGKGDGDCKIGTISVFQTGKVIITGANSYEQVQEMYNFINGIFKKHYEELFFREPSF